MVRSQGFALLAALLTVGMIGVEPLWAEVPTEYQPKYDEGYGLGYPVGYKSGLVSGKTRGWEEGRPAGESAGFDTGWSEAYSPAFDLAYDEKFPIGHRSGWDDGVVAGFQEGFDYAPTIAAAILTNWYNGGDSTSGITITMGGILSISGTNFFGHISTIDSSFLGSIDWAKRYFDDGFSIGHAEGFSIGSDDGYNLTYPIAYAAGYKIGYPKGVGQGTLDGTLVGGQQGFDEGWDLGYDGGFDEGFYAGIDYHLFGEYFEPSYALRYTPRSDASTARALVVLQAAPEPGSLALLGVAMVIGCLRRSRAWL